MHVAGPIFVCSGRAKQPNYNGTMFTPADMTTVVKRFYNRSTHMNVDDEHAGSLATIGEVLNMWVDNKDQLIVHMRLNPATVGGKRRIAKLNSGKRVGLSLEAEFMHKEGKNGIRVVTNKYLRRISTVDLPDHSVFVSHFASSEDALLKTALGDFYGPEAKSTAEPAFIKKRLKRHMLGLWKDATAPASPEETEKKSNVTETTKETEKKSDVTETTKETEKKSDGDKTAEEDEKKKSAVVDPVEEEEEEAGDKKTDEEKEAVKDPEVPEKKDTSPSESDPSNTGKEDEEKEKERAKGTAPPPVADPMDVDPPAASPAVSNNTNSGEFNAPASKVVPAKPPPPKALFPSDSNTSPMASQDTAVPPPKDDMDIDPTPAELLAKQKELEATIERLQSEKEEQEKKTPKRSREAEGGDRYDTTHDDLKHSWAQLNAQAAEVAALQGVATHDDPEVTKDYIQSLLDKAKKQALEQKKAMTEALAAQLRESGVSEEQMANILNVANNTTNPEAAAAVQTISAMAGLGRMGHRAAEERFQHQNASVAARSSVGRQTSVTRQQTSVVGSSLLAGSRGFMDQYLAQCAGTPVPFSASPPGKRQRTNERVGINSEDAQRGQVSDRDAQRKLTAQWAPKFKREWAPSEISAALGPLSKEYGSRDLFTGNAFVAEYMPTHRDDPFLSNLQNFIRVNPPNPKQVVHRSGQVLTLGGASEGAS